ncbi:MAG: hypothetical protein KatS3mg087_0711 [Patescibacteria group bacterium]|nr:MAG: hypothetical protein KatS3mg087_0711 [Patescibacteria group bacterium]
MARRNREIITVTTHNAWSDVDAGGKVKPGSRRVVFQQAIVSKGINLHVTGFGRNEREAASNLKDGRKRLLGGAKEVSTFENHGFRADGPTSQLLDPSLPTVVKRYKK